MLPKSVNTGTETSSATTPKAPADFTETLADFSTANKKSSILAAWMTAILVGPVFVFGGAMLGGWPLAIIALALVLVWPIMTKCSYEANNEMFRYYTWIYRTTKPQMGRIEVITMRTDTGIVRTAIVWIGEKEYKCDVIPNTDSPMRIVGLAEGVHEMRIYVIPDNGEPLCAELGDLRIWLEPALFKSLRG
ncbi:MAG: hypothetical protein JST89_00110 [Cyanobacteria bacterium SZAS-4]|nr:hypothetical protein [Cyanobacteria bacterium SZAS-4]